MTKYQQRIARSIVRRQKLLEQMLDLILIGNFFHAAETAWNIRALDKRNKRP